MLFGKKKKQEEETKAFNKEGSSLFEQEKKKYLELAKTCENDLTFRDSLLLKEELVSYYESRYSNKVMDDLTRFGNQYSKMVDTTLPLSDMKGLLSDEEYSSLKTALETMGVDYRNLHEMIYDLDFNLHSLIKKKNYKQEMMSLYDLYWSIDISKDGKIKKIREIYPFGNEGSEWALDMDIHDFKNEMQKRDKKDAYARIKEWIETVENHNKRRDIILDLTLLRLTMGNPRRAYFFAKDFGLDLSIPVSYGANRDNSFDRSFLYQYLDDGGDPYLQIKTSSKKEEIISLCNRIMSSNVTEQEFEEIRKIQDRKEQQLEVFLGILNAYNETRKDNLEDEVENQRILRKMKR